MQYNQFINDLLVLISDIESGKSVGGIKLARIIKHLTEMEVEEGGPYSLDPDRDAPDVGLNLVIAYFLALQDIRLPKLDFFLEKKLSQTDAPLGGVMDDETIHELIDKYQALARNADKEDPIKRPIAYDEDEQRTMRMIQKKFDDRFSNFSPVLRERAKSAVEKTIRGNRDKQMSLMAYYTKASLGKSGENISDELVANMGLANIFFWTAFIIYDDFWDKDEAADPKLLPIANIFARHYTDFFSTLLPEESSFRPFFHTLMDDLDAANAWETEFCRAKIEGSMFHIPEKLPDYGDYENKYRPASGHIVGPLALIAMQGYGPDTAEAQHLIAYFRHYLIAMQLNDDAHDWEEDLARGHLSTVVTMLLDDLKKAGWRKSMIDLSTDIPELKKIFWFKTMPRYVQTTLSHTARSRAALAKLPLIENYEPLLRIIRITENAARSAEKEQADTDALIKEYSS